MEMSLFEIMPLVDKKKSLVILFILIIKNIKIHFTQIHRLNFVGTDHQTFPCPVL